MIVFPTPAFMTTDLSYLSNSHGFAKDREFLLISSLGKPLSHQAGQSPAQNNLPQKPFT
jgi:hypothetical protein